MNWVLQLNNSQLENSFNSLLEKHHVSNSPNPPNPNAIQSVIDRGNLRTQNVFLWFPRHPPFEGMLRPSFIVEQQPVGKLVQQSLGEVQHAAFSQLTQPRPNPICDRSGKPDSTEDVFVVEGETPRSHEIDEKGLHKEHGSSDRSGKPDNLSGNTRVEQTHDGSGQPVERNSSSAHTVKEQFASEENRDIASFNTDNEFNRAINEENIDFNIPGVPHSKPHIAFCSIFVHPF